MNLQELNLDQRIDRDHAALERAEQDALHLIERLKQIPAAAPLTRSKRSYGTLGAANPWHGGGNLTAQAAVTSADPALAGYLARLEGKSLPAPDHSRLQREADRAAAATRLAEATEQMRARREARAAAQQAATDPIRGRWNSFTGSWT